jgi:hypothetical protein
VSHDGSCALWARWHCHHSFSRSLVVSCLCGCVDKEPFATPSSAHACVHAVSAFHIHSVPLCCVNFLQARAHGSFVLAFLLSRPHVLPAQRSVTAPAVASTSKPLRPSSPHHRAAAAAAPVFLAPPLCPLLLANPPVAEPLWTTTTNPSVAWKAKPAQL